MLAEPLGITADAAWRVAVSALAMYVAVLVYTRIAGLRSFAQISAFDFAMTVAVGSIIASVAVTSSATPADGALALGVLYLAQVLVALGRRRLGLARLVDNQPRVVFAAGRYLDDQLGAARLTRADLRGKLRGAGVRHLDDVEAVVLETTGDVSVIPGVDGARPLDERLLEGVRGRDAVPTTRAAEA